MGCEAKVGKMIYYTNITQLIEKVVLSLLGLGFLASFKKWYDIELEDAVVKFAVGSAVLLQRLVSGTSFMGLCIEIAHSWQ